VQERREPQGLASVIVVCWNSAQVLGRCLEHLFAQDHPDYEVIVVDDGSRDATAAVAEEAAREHPLTLVRSPRNRGCPAARNLGLERARGDVVAFIDDDGFAAPDWLREVCAPFAGDEHIGAVASTVFYADNPLVLNGAGGTINRQGWAADLSMNRSYEDAEIVTEALYPMGCGMAVSRRALDRVGAFDDRMRNYYDDVDYGIRVWSAGFRVAVAADAWIDHAAAAGGSSERALLCERHRARVMLKHTPAEALRDWWSHEVRSWRAAPAAIRARKLRSLGWNVRHLPSVVAYRRAHTDSPQLPDGLIDDSRGDAFPVGVPPRAHPRPELAGERLEMAAPEAEGVLPYGWFPLERRDGRSYRWATTRAAVLVRLERPAKVVRIDFRHVPVDIGGVEVELRSPSSPDPATAAWSVTLRWQFIERSVENHPLELPPGDYELLLSAAPGWSDPPAEMRALALALESVVFKEQTEVPAGGLDMDHPGLEEQLVSGWFEAEHGEGRSYRWAGANARALVRLEWRARAARIIWREAPGGGAGVRLAVQARDGHETLFSASLEPGEDEDGWREQSLELELAPGEYQVWIQAGRTWSNAHGEHPDLWAEARTLGFALSALTFLPAR
jgi:GT2 family glycosyltransferase